jgi:putative ABC transport system permease protein
MIALASRNLWRNRRRTAIALSAIVFGTMVVLLLDGLRNGLNRLLSDGMVKAAVGAFQVHRKGFVENLDANPLALAFVDTPELRGRIAGVPGVADLAPRVSFPALATTPTGSSLTFVLASEPASESRVFPLGARYVAGTNLVQSKLSNAAVVATPLLATLKLSAGDTFVLTSQGPDGQTNALDMQVEGWLPFVDPLTGSRLMGMKLDEAQRLLRMEGRITEYAVQIHDLEQLEQVAAATRAALGPDYEVHTWLQLQPIFRDLMTRQSFVLGMVSLVLFVIVITGIINVMAMSVHERVREIGTMMALGFRRRSVLRLFLLEGTLLGLIGGAAGAGLGYGLVRWSAAIGIPFKAPGSAGTMPMHPWVSPGFLATAVGVAALGALLAALYPALKAARMRPVDALRAV